MELKDRWVHFQVRDVYYPEPAAVLSELHGADLFQGLVVDITDGLYVEAERGRDGAPVQLAFSVGERRLGKVTHVDGSGWSGFELPTSELKGQKGELVAEGAPDEEERLPLLQRRLELAVGGGRAGL